MIYIIVCVCNVVFKIVIHFLNIALDVIPLYRYYNGGMVSVYSRRLKFQLLEN